MVPAVLVLSCRLHVRMEFEETRWIQIKRDRNFKSSRFCSRIASEQMMREQQPFSVQYTVGAHVTGLSI